MAAEPPPIIISNGGIAEELAKDLKPANPKDERPAWRIIWENVDKLNERCTKDLNLPRPVAVKLKRPRKLSPKIYWRLERERKHENGEDGPVLP